MTDETTPARPRLLPSTRFLIALLVCFGFSVQYAQRINLSIAIVCMVNKTKLNVTQNNKMPMERQSIVFEEQQFFWTELQQQIILGSYWAGYLLTLVPSGWLSMTLGARIMYATAIFISSCSTIAVSGIYFLKEYSFYAIIILRILTGAAHGTLFPVTYTLWGKWAVPNERSTLTSVGFCGTNIGTSFIVLIGGLLCRYIKSGWMHTFLLSGLIGFLWLPLWLWNVSDSPEGHRSISNTERNYITNIIGKSSQNRNRRPISITSLPWNKMIRSKPVIGLFFTELCNLFGLFFFLGNLGKILTEIHHVPTQYTGYVLACGFLFMLFGTVSSGVIADYCVRNNILTITGVRKLFNSLTSFLPCLCMIAFYFADENLQILGIIGVVGFLFSSGFGYGSGYVVNFSDIVPAYSALIFGIATSISSFNAVIGSIIAGILIKQPTLNDWRRLFIIFFIVYAIGGIIYLLFGSGDAEEWATFKSLEKQQTAHHAQEEMVPMKDESEKSIEESKKTESVA